MIKKLLILFTVFILTASGVSYGADDSSLDSLLKNINEAIRDGEPASLADFIDEENGIVIAGIRISREYFPEAVSDTEQREFAVRDGNSISTVQTDFKTLMFGDDGIFSRLENTLLHRHFETDLENLDSEETWAGWEHGEFETGLVYVSAEMAILFVPPVHVTTEKIYDSLDAYVFTMKEDRWSIAEIIPHYRPDDGEPEQEENDIAV